MEYEGLTRVYGVRKQSIYHHGDAVYVASTITQPTSCNTFIVKLMNEERSDMEPQDLETIGIITFDGLYGKQHFLSYPRLFYFK